jgi:hypothetical protein
MIRRIRIHWNKIKWCLAFQLTGTAISLLCSGCTTTGYFGDRGRDASDIFTATVGVGLGAKARVGPVHAGLLMCQDRYGLRYGERVWPSTVAGDMWDLDLTALCHDQVSLTQPRGGNVYSRRKKDYIARPLFSHTQKGYLGPESGLGMPFVCVLHPDKQRNASQSIAYFTQIDVVLAIGGSVRLGFNPGELADFLLGWTTLDIFRDDLKKDKKANNRMDRYK